MLRWIIIAALLVTSAIFGVMYYQFSGTEAPTSLDPMVVDLNPKPIPIVNGYTDGFHRLTGIVKLAHSCFGVNSGVVADPTDPAIIHINLYTKDNFDRDPSSCVRYPTQYPFEVITEGPEAITIHLWLDGKELLVESDRTDWVNPKGNVINPNPL
jgi:hypothetical protein